jgi:Sigma-70, region 4
MTAAADHHAEAPQPALVLIRPGISRLRPPVLSQPAGRAAADSEAISELRRARVRAALAQLAPERRQVIIEMYFRGHSVAEISQTLGVRAGTVNSRAYYGLRELCRVVSAMSGDLASRPIRIDSRCTTAPLEEPGRGLVRPAAEATGP